MQKRRKNFGRILKNNKTKNIFKKLVLFWFCKFLKIFFFSKNKNWVKICIIQNSAAKKISQSKHFISKSVVKLCLNGIRFKYLIQNDEILQNFPHFSLYDLLEN